jgi:pimeloyl-ACP methyl ester carboxylesterase
LYLHPNSGSRVDVVKTRIMSIAATAKCTVCGFDFSGCGSSDGDDVSLGVREKEDICAVMSYLLSRGCKRFVLWGRSMGAASAAMFFGAYKEVLRGTVVALILDSPFTSMHGLASEYTAATKIPVPGLLLSPALHLLRQNVLSKHAFDILHISPVAAASRITVPTVVLSGSEDKIVPPALSESIYEALNGPKLRVFFKGGHNTHRPAVVFDAIRVVLTGAWLWLLTPLFLSICKCLLFFGPGLCTKYSVVQAIVSFYWYVTYLLVFSRPPLPPAASTGALRGLHPAEFLHLSEAVVTNHSTSSTTPCSSSSPSAGHARVSSGSSGSGSSGSGSSGSGSGRDSRGGAASESSSSAKQSALDQEQAVASLLQAKDVDALTETDIKLAIGMYVFTTRIHFTVVFVAVTCMYVITTYVFTFLSCTSTGDRKKSIVISTEDSNEHNGE